MARRTKAEAELTRQLILDAAERVFRDHGVARTTLQDVAAAAGVTRGAIYWHFEDKAQLFAAMMDRVTLPCECAVASARAGAGQGLREELLAMVLAPLRLLQADLHLQQVFHIAMHRTEYTEDMAAVQQRHLDAVDGFQQQMAAVLESARQQGELRPGVQAAAAAMGLFCLVDGLMHQWTLAPQRFDLASTGQATLQAMIDGLFCEAAAAAQAATAAQPGAPAPARRKSRARPAPST
jgi:TetR/AcrR family acrAB operon transcriptional repressor